VAAAGGGANNPWLKISDVIKQIDISETTCRRYVRDYGEFLTLQDNGKSTLISNESLDVLRSISDLLKDGLGKSAVKEVLIKNHAITVDPIIEEEKSLKLMIEEMMKQNLKQNNRIDALIEEIHLLNRNISMISATSNETRVKKPGFFSRIFRWK
jgi:hypothetical protein